MTKPMVWGISKWRDWNSCEAMFQAKYITKQWKDFPNSAMARGRDMHTAMEEAIKYGTDLPDEIASFRPVAKHFYDQRHAKDGHVVPEQKLGISRCFQPVDYFYNDGLRVRAAFDLYVRDGDDTLIIDWKTGKPKQEHHEDARFYGACAGVGYGRPKVVVQYVYLDDPDASFSEVVTEPEKALSNWWKKFDTADRAIAAGKFDQMPGMQCSWCGFAACPHNRNKKLGK